MNNYSYQPLGVCAKRIDFTLDNNCIHNLSFEGGCPGNLKAIALLLEGEDARVAIKKLKGNRCGKKMTSCADQLAIALEDALRCANNEPRQSPPYLGRLGEIHY